MDKDTHSKRGEELFKKYQDGTASHEERAVVESWYLTEAHRHPQAPVRNLDHIRDTVWKQLRPSRKLSTFLTYTAALLMIGIAFGIYFTIAEKSPAKEVQPGHQQATLTLADGSQINLDSSKEGIQIRDEKISYNDGSVIIPPSSDPIALTSETQELKLTTPKGGQYMVILSDGSKVWLNCASTLTYPSKFTGSSRIVKLVGEAYFSIAKSSPFIVKSHGQEVRVLGTEFNLSAFADEKEIKTTLVSGAVQVMSQPSGQVVRLAPGEQSTLTGNELTKAKVDSDSYLAWKNGYFDFNQKTFGQAMRELARWYNLTISYDGTVPDVELFGSINRGKNLSSILELLKASNIKYQLEGQKLTIINLPKK